MRAAILWHADYYNVRLLDTDAPEYKTEKNLLTEKLDEPLLYGFPQRALVCSVLREGLIRSFVLP